MAFLGDLLRGCLTAGCGKPPDFPAIKKAGEIARCLIRREAEEWIRFLRNG